MWMGYFGTGIAQQATQPREPTPVHTPAGWLLDAARDYGHGLRGRPTLSDVQITLTLLQAAGRLDPDLPGPYRWQADLFEDLQQPNKALAALGQYVAHDPTDITARLEWIGHHIVVLQTVEARRQFTEQQLAGAADSPLVRADARRRLAEIAYARADQAEARKQIAEALKLAPNDPAVNRLAYEINATPDDRAAQVAAALKLVSANPMQIHLVWQLANLLDDLSLHAEAQFWYTHALAVHRAANPGKDPPADRVFELARSLADGGDLEPALNQCAEAIRINPGYVRARLLMIHILRKLRRGESALEQIRAVADHYAKLVDHVVKTRDARMAAEMAWFYALYDPRPDQAVQFAQIAVAGVNPPPEAMRAYGFALLAKNNLPEAEKVLKDLAPTDQMAAVGLAKVYLATKKAHLAVPVLQDAARLRATGFAHDEIAQMLHDNGLSAPPPKDYPEVRKLLAEFNKAPLEYYKRPADFLRLSMRFVRQRAMPGEPWCVAFELANVATFIITFGEEMMVVPNVLLSAVTRGDAERQFPHYMLVRLDRVPALHPGETVRVTDTVDVGPIRRAMTMTPQAVQEVTLTGLLDPVQSPDGNWTHRLGGFAAPAARMTRAAFEPSAQSVADLKSALASSDPAEVLRAAGILTSLLVEHDAIRDGTLKYKAVPVDAPQIAQDLISAAGVPGRDPVLRARLIESFRRVRLMDALIKPLAPNLSDPHWLVRFTTAWLFAHKQGPAFSTVARRMSTSDPDPLVRELTAAYLEKWRQHAPTATPISP